MGTLPFPSLNCTALRRSGVAHGAWDNDVEALLALREFFGFLPLSCKGMYGRGYW